VGLVYMAFWGPKLEATLTLQMLVVAGIATVAGSILGKNIMRVIRFRDTLKQIAAGLALCFCGWLIGGMHLIVFDKLYLRRGRIQALLSKLPAKDG